jgi:hypothetical protein
MYLSYSGFKKAVTCLFAYWHEYPNKTPKTGPDDRLGSIYGSVVGKLFEDFYTQKVWLQPNPKEFLLGRVTQTVDAVIKQETTTKGWKTGGILLWKGTEPNQNPKGLYANRAELEADIRDAIPRGLDTIRQYKLIGPRADAEYKLDFKTPKGHILGGRADFIIQRVRPFSDLLIVDGKGSKHRDSYVDPQQLVWYAMLFYLHSVSQGKPQLPDKLAFLYWRCNPDKAMDWLGVSEDDVKALLSTVLDTISDIEEKLKILPAGVSMNTVRGVFKPKANESNCRFCPYTAACPLGNKIQEELKCRQH